MQPIFFFGVDWAGELIMEPTAFALVALICTQNNLVCRDATEGTKTYETAELCRDGIDRVSQPAIPDGYKLVSRCVPVSAENDAGHKYEWAMNWVGEPVAYVVQAAGRTATETASVGHTRITEPDRGTDSFDSLAQVTWAASGRVLATLNTVASLK
jgi:hypothetical protein